jgi:hypothetical protein
VDFVNINITCKGISVGDYDKDNNMKGKEPTICKKFRRIFKICTTLNRKAKLKEKEDNKKMI